MAYPSQTSIHKIIDTQVGRTPDAPAVIFRDQQWSYRVLNAQANGQAARLIQRGVGPGSRVGVCVPRSLELMSALLGVLKTGAAYVPIDPGHPEGRVSMLLADSEPTAVIACAKTASRLRKFGKEILLAEDVSADESVSTGTASGDDPAYIMYTSGSTGKPKGVVVLHRNVLNFFAAMDAVIGPTAGVWLAVTSFAFDISVFELFWTLARGFTVVIQEEQFAGVKPEYSFARQIKQHSVTHFQCTPSLAMLLARDPESFAAISSLRYFIVGGEAFPLDLARKLSGAMTGELYNMYGPTETTIWSTAQRICPDAAKVSIGRPIANTQLYVLDEALHPVAIGEPGELYIGGDGVAAGYLHRPDLTAERFIPDPFSTCLNSRLYRTGDIVKYDLDATVDFLGRADQQIKIRGVRVELTEIEAVLREHASVQEAAVVVRKNELDQQILLAYCVLDSAYATGMEELQRWLREKLPEPMIPAAVMQLPAIPKNSNGKVDRNALPSPPKESATIAEKPANELERQIAAVWTDVLGFEPVPLERGFFDLGGHSLLMAEVHDQLLDKLPYDVALVDLFRYPTVRALATYLQDETKDVAGKAAQDRGHVRKQMNRSGGRGGSVAEAQ